MKYVVVGEAWSEACEDAGEPFSDGAGRLLKAFLRDAGISLKECYFTTVLSFRPPGGDVMNLCGAKEEGIPGMPAIARGKFLKAKYQEELDRLAREIAIEQPVVVIALGATALWALTKKTGIKKFRGTVLPGELCSAKVVPTWNTGAVIRMWKLRPVVVVDLQKAKREAAFPEIRRPRREIWIEPTLEDIHEFRRQFIDPSDLVSCDIETAGGKIITEVGFAPDPHHAIVIPFFDKRRGNYWEEFHDERQAWKIIREIIATKPTFGQNFQYDVKWLWYKMGMPALHWVGDTMLAHHALQPEMEKSLGWLASIYTDEPAWKFMRTEKKED